MAASVPTKEPEEFTQGERVHWTKSLGDYLPADNWTLSYAFVKSDDQQTVTATDNGDGTHLTTITSTASANFLVGTYEWQAKVTDTSSPPVVVQVERGHLTVKQDFSAAGVSTGYDDRSHAEIVLDALEATLEGKATEDQLSYSIGTGETQRSISKLSPGELIQWHQRYKRLVEKELRAERIKKGLGHAGRVKVRFSGP